MRTIWVLGDQLNREIGALADADPATDCVLLVESDALLSSARWHRQRAHLVVTAMRRFAAELRDAGFDVDHRRATTLRDGLQRHVADHAPSSIAITEPNSWSMRQWIDGRSDIEIVRSNQFLCHYDDFAAWASDRRQLKMEDFYRWRRRELGYLMDGDEPVTGRWNYDDQNREPPPKHDPGWPTPQTISGPAAGRISQNNESSTSRASTWCVS